MQKVIITNVIALLITVAAMAQNSKVAVFNPDGRVDNSIKEIIREEISSVMVNARYTVLEREQIDRVLKENRYQESGLVDDSQKIEMGKHLGANLVLVSSVTQTGNEYYISCKLIDVETARIEKQKTFQTQRTTSEIICAVQRIVGEMFGQTMPEDDFLFAEKRKIIQNGVKLKKYDVWELMSNTDALHLYNKGRTRNRNGNIWLATGALLSAGGAYIAATMPLEERYEYTDSDDGLSYYGYHEHRNLLIGGSIAAAGVVMAITGITMKTSSKKFIRQSVDSYNSLICKPKSRAGMEMKLDFTGNGVVLSFKF
jgi:hypothetical protein